MMKSPPLPELLARIGLESPPAPSVASLHQLIRAYRLSIPFENLDVMAGKPPSTEIGAVIQKLVFGQRGGWCYELNQLLAVLLEEVGYKVNLRLARVAYRRPGLGPLTHLLLQVGTEDSSWLVDAGFGGPGPNDPIPMIEGEIICGEGSRFHLMRSPEGNLRLHRWIEDAWTCLYEISRIEVLPIDLEMSSHFLATWSHSPFRRRLICTAYDGRWNWTLEANKLLQRDANWEVMEHIPIRDISHLQSLLESHFNINAPKALIRNVWSKVDKET